MSEIRVLTFGPLAEQLGWQSVMVKYEPGEKISGILHRLGISEIDQRACAIVVEGQSRAIEDIIGEAKELAILPPVSGG